MVTIHTLTRNCHFEATKWMRIPQGSLSFDVAQDRDDKNVSGS
jgi:hypothetical protein